MPTIDAEEVYLNPVVSYEQQWGIFPQSYLQGTTCTKEAAMAKAFMNEVYKHCTRVGVQIHGGIGTTRDHDMGLYYQRARQAASLFGDSVFWQKRLAREIGV